MTTTAAPTTAPTAHTSTLGLVWTQVRYQLMAFTRSPVALFFSIGLPTVMLVMLNATVGTGSVDTPYGSWPTSQFYAGGLSVFAAVSVSYTGLVNMLPVRREEGVIKRWRANPLPSWIYISGWILSSVIMAAVGVILLLAIGVAAYGLQIEAAKVPSMILVFLIGVLAFSALGVGVAGLVPNSEAAPAVANATILPLAFISDVFIPLDGAPRWLEVLGNVFPLKPFAQAFQDTVNPLVDPPALAWGKLAVVAAWGIFGVVLARSTFKWEPPAHSSGRRSGRRRH